MRLAITLLVLVGCSSAVEKPWIQLTSQQELVLTQRVVNLSCDNVQFGRLEFDTNKVVGWNSGWHVGFLQNGRRAVTGEVRNIRTGISAPILSQDGTWAVGLMFANTEATSLLRNEEVLSVGLELCSENNVCVRSEGTVTVRVVTEPTTLVCPGGTGEPPDVGPY